MPRPEERPFSCSSADGKNPLKDPAQPIIITYSNGTRSLRCPELGFDVDNICRATIATSFNGKGIPCPWVG